MAEKIPVEVGEKEMEHPIAVGDVKPRRFGIPRRRGLC